MHTNKKNGDAFRLHVGNISSPCPQVIRIEGVKILATALAAGWQPSVVVAAYEHSDGVAALLKAHALPALPLYEGKLSEVRSGMVQPRVEAVVAEGPAPAPLSWPPAGGGRLQPAVALACQDPNNTGTIVRTAVAMGALVGRGVGGGGRRGRGEGRRAGTVVAFHLPPHWPCSTGVRDIFVCNGGADPLSALALRASAGAVLSANLYYGDTNLSKVV